MPVPARNPLVTALVALALCAGPAAAQQGDAASHLLAGVRAFRADHYDEALREFRLVEQAGGADDLALYLGPTLYKLDRFEEARAVLARAHRSSSRDAVADYYLGLSYYRLGLARLARAVFVSIDPESAGPRLAAGAARFVAELDARPPQGGVSDLLATAETAAAPDAAFDRAAEAWLRSAPGSSERARAAVVILRTAGGACAIMTAVDLLDADPRLPHELRLALARLALSAGAVARARPMLDEIRRGSDPSARHAAEELARGRL